MQLVLDNREQHVIDGKWIDVKPGEDRRMNHPNNVAKAAAALAAARM